MQGMTFIYMQEAVLTGAPVVESKQLTTDAHPYLVRGHAGLAVVLFGITEEQLEVVNGPLCSALKASLATHGGEFIEAKLKRAV